MGVTRTLMASNDTLFNFEDTLGDREELTPTPCSAPQSAFSVAMSPSKAHVQSMNETFPLDATRGADSTFVLPDAAKPTPSAKSKPPMNLDFTAAVRADTYTSALDVLSPELQKTFSEDITSVEHVSGSDASGNMDPDGTYTTNTIEMETCISLNKDEDVGECDFVEDLEQDDQMEDQDIDDSEQSLESSSVSTANVAAVEEANANGAYCNGVVVEEETDTENGAVDDPLEQTKLFLAREIDYNRWHKVSSNCVDAAVFHVQTIAVAPQLEMDLDKCGFVGSGKQTDSLVGFGESNNNNNVTFDLNENTYGQDTHRTENCLSGEEDPWGTDSHHNRDSDDDHCEEEDEEEDGDGLEEDDGQSVDTSDDSSGEFMYVGGMDMTEKNGHANGKRSGEGDAWDSHVDQVPFGRKGLFNRKRDFGEEKELRGYCFR